MKASELIKLIQESCDRYGMDPEIYVYDDATLNDLEIIEVESYSECMPEYAGKMQIRVLGLV